MTRLGRSSFTAAFLLVAQVLAAQTPRPDSSTDPFRWLEDVNGTRAMTWVKGENAKSTGVLEKDRRFAGFYHQALDLAQASDRIPYGSFIGGQVYNFWQDSAHVRGIWRRTSLASFRSATPAWTTVLDLDSLARVEKANWVWEGADCAWPAESRCLLSLSDGGEDATTVREFDVGTRSFVPGGFVLPHGKQQFAWVGTDTLLVAREWKKGDLTKSGYPFIVKRLVRGQPLAAAVEIFRGARTDVSAGTGTFDDGTGHRVVMIDRGVTFFESEHYIVRPSGVVKLALPLKSSVVALVDGQLIVRPAQRWLVGALHVTPGTLVSIDAAAATADPKNLSATVIYAPGPRESVGSVATTRDRLVVSIYQNVKGRVMSFAHANDAWTHQALPLPDNLSTDVASADQHGDVAFVDVTGFLTPSSVLLADAKRGTVTTLKTLPARFDASNDVVEQFEATSKDGTKVPYFVVHPKAMKLDGLNPTILYAYGGFEVSMTPSYSSTIGKLWLEHGGVYVLANIRGGGEFGPAWHDAGLKTHRQVVYDDFAAVAQDLIARKITSPAKLGIQGGSNGGLLMGVELTQHPELWNAVDIQVPLLDMLRYEHIAAGASWVGEYGSVSVPAERAFLASISPYNNLKAGVKYPEPFIWSTTKDDRVGPQHARKFAAKMSAMGDPYLYYEVIEGGHGSGANLKERAHTTALEFTYFAERLLDGQTGRTTP